MNPEEKRRAWLKASAARPKAPLLETQEPITLETPLCGLGEDYQPFELDERDELFFPLWKTKPTNLEGLEGFGRGGQPLGFLASETEAMRLSPSRVVKHTLESARHLAASHPKSSCVALIDANLNILKTWPI